MAHLLLFFTLTSFQKKKQLYENCGKPRTGLATLGGGHQRKLKVLYILGVPLMNSCNTDIFFSNYYHLQSVRFELNMNILRPKIGRGQCLLTLFRKKLLSSIVCVFCSLLGSILFVGGMEDPHPITLFFVEQASHWCSRFLRPGKIALAFMLAFQYFSFAFGAWRSLSRCRTVKVSWVLIWSVMLRINGQKVSCNLVASASLHNNSRMRLTPHI